MEAVTWQNIAMGMFMSMLSMHLMGKFFDFDEIQDVNFYKLIGYPFWLISRIYVDAFFLIKLVLTDSKWGIMTTKLELENESLRIVLADSITLTPGSVYLERDEETISLLCIGDRKNAGYPDSIEGLRRIERILLKSQK